MANFRTRFFANQGLITYSNQGPGFELDPSVGVTNGGFIVPCYAAGESQIVLSLTSSSEFTVDVGATCPATAVLVGSAYKVTGTMPNGTTKGQVKTITLLSQSGVPGGVSEEFVLTGSNLISPSPNNPTITKYDFTFNDYVTLMWTGTGWANIAQGGLEQTTEPTPG